MWTTPKALRDSVLARLQAATGAGGRLAGYTVEASRVEPVNDSDPEGDPPDTVLVYLTSRDDDPHAPYGHRYQSRRTMTIRVDGFCCGTSGVDLEARMDALGDAFVALLLQDQTWLNGLSDHPTCSWAYLIDGTSDRFLGNVVLTLTCNVTGEVA